MSKEEIERITEENYNKIVTETDINNNVYMIQENGIKIDINYDDIYLEINKISEKINKLKQENNSIWKEREYFKEQTESKDTEIENLRKTNENLNNIIEQYKKYKEELIAIKNGKLYKLINKVKNTNKN